MSLPDVTTYIAREQQFEMPHLYALKAGRTDTSIMLF